MWYINKLQRNRFIITAHDGKCKAKTETTDMLEFILVIYLFQKKIFFVFFYELIRIFGEQTRKKGDAVIEEVIFC